MSIKFKETFYNECEERNLIDALRNGSDYLLAVRKKLSAIYGTDSIFLTSNASLAMDILLLSYKFSEGSEVIIPSFTYPSVANSILRSGLVPIFCDIDPHTLVMDISDAKKRETEKTVCIIPTHYGGVSCDIERLKIEFAGKVIIEDAALSIGGYYKGKPLGTVCDAGIVSFHNTKNVSSEEGGAIILNDTKMLEKVETIYQNGTDRQKFLSGEVLFYSWQEVGFNAIMSNLSAAVLCAQIDKLSEITSRQTDVFDNYMKILRPVALKYKFDLIRIPEYNTGNAHVFYVLFENEFQRNRVKLHLESLNIGAVIHYIPLHQSKMGKSLGYLPQDLPCTLNISERILRLPMHANMTKADCVTIAHEIGNAL